MKVLRIAALPLLLVIHAFGADTALDRYVKKPDASYKYQVVSTTRGEGYTSYVIDMTSQTWRLPSEVDRTVWKHWMTLVKPDRVEGTTGFLFIAGGSVTAKAPARASQSWVENALATHSVVAELMGVPNEPVQFADETRTRNEDGIIAYTWMKYMRTGDETWPLRLPMTKAAVRAMDTITAVMATPEVGGVKVEKFVVSGGSKRGWTTWTAAAVDRRVVAIAPASIDLLNLEKSFEHHFRVYGFFAPAVKDYVESGFMDWAGTPEYRKLLEIEEPYSYRERLTMPKFMVQGAGDQFFLPDSSRFYFDDLKGEKYLRYVPNADHGLKNTDAVESILAFYEAFLKGTPRPQFTWTFEADGGIRVVSKDKPTAVKLWQATNPDTRDFRLMTIGPAFRAEDLHDRGGGVYVGRVPKPEKGWSAYFVGLEYPSGAKYPFQFSTAVRVIPDTEPFPPYQPKREGR
ncbi:MAG: PhoPQ-activated pathogenicity-related family protein [Candidatus Solibacter sp.]|nr:PhoPQ-activated pathogenicity-related family protein [Candidatus Solibacter sp.]